MTTPFAHVPFWFHIRGWVQTFPASPIFKVTEIKQLCYFSI